MKTIVVGGGCFWCMDPIYRSTEGITEVMVGYAGGGEKNPSYREVAHGKTGHAEVLRLSYDPEAISLKKILEIFFTMHDPTTLNQQGADKGTQYRSIILYEDKNDMVIAKQIIQELNQSGVYKNSIVTEVVPLQTFYPAEESHQNYFAKNPNQAYCQIVIAPKIEKFKKVFSVNKNND